ncbi:MAG: LytTR family DNA-binding domain-containing protein [Urechidicola sp.]|nr:LytTR family DNA-binding domain-containing protein [Urechidicola sp.]
MKKYSALIVDDDQESILLLKNYLNRHCPDVVVMATATNIVDAINEFNKYTPEILLLDIQLNDENIFSFIDKIENLTSQLIFISSHDEFALKAIKYQATDFVTKPIQINDLFSAVNRAIQKINLSKKKNSREVNELTFIAISSIDSVDIIKIDDIIYCEADGRYTNFHLSNMKTKISCRNLGEYEEMFSRTDFFFRIHYKYIVNLNKLISIDKAAGNYCEFGDGISLPIAKRRQQELAKFLKLK